MERTHISATIRTGKTGLMHFRLLSVADGVGGWSESGIDPSLYSQSLCKKYVHLYTANSIEILVNQNYAELIDSPKEILIRAAAKVTEVGSSTCCILALERTSDKMNAANLGDSGFMVMRKNERSLHPLLKSKEQCHGFNFPFQVGVRC